jgi:hypothetical protein
VNRRPRDRRAPGPVPARIDLRIDELILHGVAASDRHRVADAIEHELARLIAERGVPGGLAPRADDARAPAALAVPRSGRSDDLGRGVAGAIYRALAPDTGPGSREGGS